MTILANPVLAGQDTMLPPPVRRALLLLAKTAPALLIGTLVAVGAFVTCSLGSVLWRMRPQPLEVPTVAALTGLSLPASARLAHGEYLICPRASLRVELLLRGPEVQQFLQANRVRQSWETGEARRRAPPETEPPFAPAHDWGVSRATPAFRPRGGQSLQMMDAGLLVSADLQQAQLSLHASGD